MGTSTSRYVRKKKTSDSQKERNKRVRKKLEEMRKETMTLASFDKINKLK